MHGLKLILNCRCFVSEADALTTPPWEWPNDRRKDQRKKVSKTNDQSVLSNLDSRSGCQRLCEANHTHVIGILFERLAVGIVASVQTWEAGLFTGDASAQVAARLDLGARHFGILLGM